MKLVIDKDGNFTITGKINPSDRRESSSGKSMLEFYQPWQTMSDATINGKSAKVTLTIATPLK